MNKILLDFLKSRLDVSKNAFLFAILTMTFTTMNAQVQVAPASCYPQFTPAEMDAAAAADNAATPFATWTGAYNYAVANGINTIDFAPGTYDTDLTGSSLAWGDADGGHVLPTGMTVNGNGAVINNTPLAGTSQLCFATLGTNTTVSGFVFKQMSGNPNGGALYVPSSADNWLITGCDFFNSNLGTDAVSIDMGAGLTGTIDASNFYGNNTPGGTYPQSPGLPSSSALAITGTLTSDLNITNSTFSCNFRNVSGGAIQIHTTVHVDFDGCTFYRNEANASKGGAMSIRNGAEVTINNTSFIDNFTTAASSSDDGALNIESGSTVVITNSFFKGNESADDTGAIRIAGTSASSITTVSITNTIFEGNVCADDGGTLELTNYSDVVIDNCLFLANSAGDKGGAVYVRGTSSNTILIQNCTITGNVNPGEGGVTVNGTNNNITFDNCVAVGNDNLDFHVEEGSITVNNSYYGGGSGTINGTGNTTGYAGDLDGNYNDSSGAGWTGTYSSPTGAGVCPSVPAVADDCSDQGSIGGIVWDDTSSPDGDSSTGSPLAGVTVNLLDDMGNIVATVITAADGSYFFGGLEDGEMYMVQIVPPAGLFPTIQDDGTAGTSNDSDFGSTFTSPLITICGTCGNNGSVDGTDATSGNSHYGSVDAGLTTVMLPVVWASFDVQRTDDCSINISWSTASEINNDRFEIQASNDLSYYTTIGVVKGQGNSDGLSEYHFIEEFSTDFNRQRYYRIKQIDTDGQFAFSGIKSLNLLDCDEDSEFNLYPSLVSDRFFVNTGNIVELEKMNISIFDVSGRMMLIPSQTKLNNNTFEFNVESFKTGIYYVRMQSNGIHKTMKFVKM